MTLEDGRVGRTDRPVVPQVPGSSGTAVVARGLEPVAPAGPTGKPPRPPSLLGLLRPYRGWIALLVVFTIASNALNLVGPRLIARGIDGAGNPAFNLTGLALEFAAIAVGAFFFTYLQSIVQTFAAERAASDLRIRLIEKISEQDFAYVQTQTPARLLTNLSSDVDAVKGFIAQAISSIISSAFLIVGASVLLLLINWRLALVVLSVVPIIGLTFRYVLGRVRKLFMRAQGAIDWLNKVINESILGSSLIRLANSQASEYDKFVAANAEARDIGMSILQADRSKRPNGFAHSVRVGLWTLIAAAAFIAGGSAYASAQAIVTIQQVSTGRYLDAYVTADEDFRVVTRTAQNNDSQRWIMTSAGATYTFRHVDTGRSLDAYETADRDYRIVTRPAQSDTTQQWIVTDLGGGIYTIEQLRTRRFLDAYQSTAQDFGARTSPGRDNNDQKWRIQIIAPGIGPRADQERIVTLQQASSGRYVDAHVTAGEDFGVVTRAAQNNRTQYWVMTRVGETTNFTFRQVSTGRYLDAYLSDSDDYRLVTRAARSGSGQQWNVTTLGGGSLFAIQHVTDGRFVDAHESEAQDFRLVTRPRQNNDTQAWRIRIVSGPAF